MKANADFKPGAYTDTTNGDMWIFTGQHWRWVNGARWSFVPRETLVWHREIPAWMVESASAPDFGVGQDEH